MKFEIEANFIIFHLGGYIVHLGGYITYISIRAAGFLKPYMTPRADESKLRLRQTVTSDPDVDLPVLEPECWCEVSAPNCISSKCNMFS